MALPNLTENEKQELRVEIPKVQLLLSKNPEERFKFLESPFGYLKKRTKISLLKFIDRSLELKKDFDTAVRALFNKLVKWMSSCAACKLAALLIIHALLAKGGIAVSALVKVLDDILEKLLDFFEGTSERANVLLKALGDAIDKLRPRTLALKFCQLIGMCKIQLVPELIPVPVIGPSPFVHS